MPELLTASEICKQFEVSGGFLGSGLFRREKVDVLKGVSLSIQCGETVGLVGESGSGKTTLARCLMGMLKPDAGSVHFNGVDLHALEARQRKTVRAEISIVYQNPYLSLNPHFTLNQLIAEPLQAQGVLPKNEIAVRVATLMEEVGLSGIPGHRKITSLSGGQAQRVSIARALALAPKLLVLDEPTSALDVSVQAQILNLLNDLQKNAGLSYLFISHDLDVVRYTCDRVLVMSEGLIIEKGETESVMQQPQHEYTKALIDSTPDLQAILRQDK